MSWVREFGTIIAAIITGVFAFLVTGLGWHVQRDREWRKMIEDDLKGKVDVADFKEMVSALERARDDQIVELKARMDRSDANMDRRFSDYRRAQERQTSLLQHMIADLGSKIDLLKQAVKNGREE